MPARIDFLFFDAGGGHRAAATALKSVIEQQGRAWHLRLVNLQEIFDPTDPFEKLTGRPLQEVYNLLLEKGWTLGMRQTLVVLHVLIGSYHRRLVRLIEDFWKRAGLSA